MIYEPQNILAQEWTFLLAYNSFFPTHPHQFMYLSYGTFSNRAAGGYLHMHSFVAMPIMILVILCSFSIFCSSFSSLAVVSKYNIIVASTYLQAVPTGWVGCIHLG